MAFDGNGTFARIMNWVQDAATLIPIKADRHDQQDDDFAAGLTNALTKDGQTQPTANIPMNGHRITNLGTPVNDSDAATKLYADTPHPSATGITISGADVNGRLNFTSATGANGLAWTGADLSWLARLATAAGPGTPPVPPATLNRLVLNTKPDGSGTDVITANDDGTLSTTGTITAATVSSVKATTGNVHFWWYGPANEDRMVIYTNSAAMGHGFLRVNGTQTFTFQNDGMFKAPVHLYAGAAVFQNDGNINGTAWGGYLSTYIENRASAYANNKVAVTQIQRVGNTYSGNVGDQNGWICPAGTVIVGYARVPGTSGAVYGLYYMTLQIYDDKNGWRNMGG